MGWSRRECFQSLAFCFFDIFLVYLLFNGLRTVRLQAGNIG